MPETSRPDAAQIPHQYKGQGLPRDAQLGLVALAEMILGVDKSQGERALVRNQGAYVFATRDGTQKLAFPDSHELRGRPRYEWKDRGDGIKLGTLVPAARAQNQPDEEVSPG